MKEGEGEVGGPSQSMVSYVLKKHHRFYGYLVTVPGFKICRKEIASFYIIPRVHCARHQQLSNESDIFEHLISQDFHAGIKKKMLQELEIKIKLSVCGWMSTGKKTRV